MGFQPKVTHQRHTSPQVAERRQLFAPSLNDPRFVPVVGLLLISDRTKPLVSA
ncbi:hypothetical protein RISK_006350 [Rhodopirellula islandica]|uniref:Uncharacterized protein n=1 Tax=Rhodopirellula islandica TaxID=595434 RepID=A0A0J1E848_RHOIS|nr:hypothetical protein RISK_006350 [Rhodopirellula islandica]